MNQSTEELNRQYQAITTLPEQAFFIGVANYARSVLDNPGLASMRAELSQKALSDYDKTIEELNQKDSNGQPEKDWKMVDFVEAGLKLSKKLDAVKDVFTKGQTENSHAWMKLQTLEMFVHDRKKAKSIYSKTPRGLQEYDQSVTELDVILSTKANERNSEEYEFWVESGRKENMQAIPRSIFIKDEYLNYLSQVHLYLLERLSKTQSSSTTIFLEGETVIYRNKGLSFKLGDGSFLSIDFSTSPDLRKVFEVFWELRRRDPSKGNSLETALEVYKQLFDENIDAHIFTNRIHHIRRTKINNKPEIKERFKISFNKSEKTWILTLR